MKKTVLRSLATLAALTTFAGVASAYTYKVIANNDLGMHCACPTFEGFLLLPPFNTIRAQVIQYGGDKPIVVSSGVTVSYSFAEETDATLQADTYFSSWIANAPKLFPGFQPVVNGKVKGLTGKGIADLMSYDSQSMSYVAAGVPAYPVTTGNTAKDIMTDPLGGPKRDPYLTANITVKNTAGTVVATTSTVVPVAFGGCCSCHLTLASQNGYPATPAGSFAYLGKMHSQNSSGIDISMIDPDGDGKGGPVRCSWCHWDPAMGESAAPGWPTGTKLLPGATFTLKKSAYSFSDVLHRFHSQSQKVLTQYDPNIANNCYDCHPGNNVNCYRGAHKGKTAIWCSDCHGNLNQRVATNQLAKPWLQATLPTCYNPSPGVNSAFACHSANTYKTNVSWDPNLFGKYINARGHYTSVLLCQTCHGMPHGENPSTSAPDNVQNSTLQGAIKAVYPTGKDKSYALGVCDVCHYQKSTTWSVPPHEL
ncbi:hypothetical protein [Geomonas ferrireducens]|uniref:hypothetical protein n=1 Tax=Geomonas ferrireducens TaxID=2570227 RepID=UPI0010A83C60|nr:hypothetical protein [Geomonas ferrireducens]